MIDITLKKLRWLTILAPAIFTGVYEFLRHAVLKGEDFFWSNIFTVFLVFGASYLFSHFIFVIIGKLQKNIEDRNNELSAINKIALALSRSLNQDEIISATAEEICKSFPDMGVALYILNDARLYLVEKKGLSGEWVPNLIEVEGNSHEIIHAGFVKAVRKSAAIAEQPNPGEYVAYLPFKGRKGIMGVILLVQSRPFSDRALEVFETISNQLGFSIENARLHSQVYEMATIEERERIAREVHDGLAQILGYVSLKASLVERLLSTGKNSQAESEVKEIEIVTQEAYTDAREAILGLRTCISKDGSFIKTLKEYINRFKLTSKIMVELDVKDGQDLKFSSAEEIQLIRIIQEALTNIRKHAKAGKAWIRFRVSEDMAQIVIEDNGQGFDISSLEALSKTKYGLQTMKERAEKIGASFQVTSFAGLGTKIEVGLPVKNRTGAEVYDEGASR